MTRIELLVKITLTLRAEPDAIDYSLADIAGDGDALLRECEACTAKVIRLACPAAADLSDVALCWPLGPGGS